MRASEVINAAADHIQAFGGIKGIGHGEGPIETAPACIVGALNVSGFEDVAMSERSRIYAAIHNQAGRNFVIFNDDPDVTDEQIVEVLRATAVIEAARESGLVEVSA